jgi:hypothetical protein
MFPLFQAALARQRELQERDNIADDTLATLASTTPTRRDVDLLQKAFSVRYIRLEHHGASLTHNPRCLLRVQSGGGMTALTGTRGSSCLCATPSRFCGTQRTTFSVVGSAISLTVAFVSGFNRSSGGLSVSRPGLVFRTGSTYAK